jgi:hypothetical protein
MADLFVNMPLPKCVEGATGIDLLHCYGKNECRDEIEAYIPKVYQWMLDNKGKYVLRDPRED